LQESYVKEKKKVRKVQREVRIKRDDVGATQKMRKKEGTPAGKKKGETRDPYYQS